MDLAHFIVESFIVIKVSLKLASETFYLVGLVSSQDLGTLAPDMSWWLSGVQGWWRAWLVFSGHEQSLLLFSLSVTMRECLGNTALGDDLEGDLVSEVMLGQLSMQCLITLRIHRGCLGHL